MMLNCPLTLTKENEMDAMAWTVAHILQTARVPDVADLPRLVHKKK